MSLVKPSDTVTVQFSVTDPSTGAASDADSLPTGTLVRNGADTGETVTIQNVTTGVYSAAVTIPAGYAAGDEVQIRVAATVGGVAGQGVVWSAQVDTLRNADIASDVWDEVLTGATHNIATSAGRRLRELGAFSIRSGTAQAGGDNSITLDSGASATDQIYDNNLVVITAGTGAGQTRVIVEYNGTTKVAIVDEDWQTNPDNTSDFQILAAQQMDITQHGIAQAGTASTITLSSDASAQDDVYNDQIILIRTSTGTGQARLITDYDGGTKVATVAPDWNINPTSDSVYAILPFAQAFVHDLGNTALAKFITDDTGETTAVAGSVAKIAQGAAGLTVDDIWGHTTRTLTSSAAAVTSAVKGSVLNIVPTVTFSATLSGLSIPSNWDKIYLTVKKNKGDVDSEALLQIVVTNGGDPDDGIVILDKTAIADSDAAADDAVLTVDQGAGTIDIDINDEATAELLAYAGNAVRHYDIKALRADDESELLTESTLVFGAVVTRTHTA